jgi:hypothetical protein
MTTMADPSEPEWYSQDQYPDRIIVGKDAPQQEG